MATVIPINLTQVCYQVNRIIALYPPVPVVQNSIVGSTETNPGPSNYTRDESLLSFGFPISRDLDSQVLSFVDGNSTVYHNNVFPLPLNSYVVVKPSQVYRLSSLLANTLTANDTLYSVLLLDVTVCPVEPGFSRLRVDYTVNLGGGQFAPVTDYLDVPFWEGWDVHPREIQEIVDFAEQSFDQIQEEINASTFLNRALERGLVVSGTLATTQSTLTIPEATLLTPEGQLASHQMPLLPEKLFNLFSQVQQVNATKSLPTTGAYNILDIQPTDVYAGETITVTLDTPAPETDRIYMANVPLDTIAVSNTLIATIPSYLTYGFKIGVQIGSNTAPKSLSYLLNVLSKPVIKKLTGEADQYVSRGGAFTIEGSGFGLNTGIASVVVSPGQTATIATWSDTLITGILPNNTDTGTVTLTTATGKIATYNVNSLPYSITDSLAISPGIATVIAGNTVQFTASLNSNTISGNWSLETPTGNIGYGNPAYGHIDSTGLYTAPSGAFGSLQLRVLCNVMTLHGTNSTTAALVVNDVPSPYTLSPATITLEPSSTQQFKLFNGTIVISQGVTWAVNGISGGTDGLGLISTAGIYQAPASPPPTGTVNITATVTGGFGNSTIRLLPKQTLNLTSHNMAKLLPVNGGGGTTPSPTPTNPTPTAPTATAPTPQVQLGTTFKATLYCTGSTAGATNVTCTNSSSSNGTFDGTYYKPGFVQQGVVLATRCSGTLNGSTTTRTCVQTVDVIAAPLPVPVLANITSVCPGQNAVVTGTNFPTDTQIKFSSNNQSLTIISAPSTADGTNYSMTVQIPSSLSTTAASYPIYLASSLAGNSNTINFSVPGSCSVPPITATLSITPSNANFTDGIANLTQQYTATLQFSNGTSQDVTSSSRFGLQSNGGGGGFSGGLGGGLYQFSSYGNITPNTGLYTTSGTASSSTQYIDHIVATYSYNGLQLTAYATATFNPAPTPPPTTSVPPTSQSTDCVIILVEPSFQKVYVPGPQIQFAAHQTINGGSDTIVQADAWFVNGIPGGDDVHGHVDSTGLYTPPLYYAPGTYTETEVAAQYKSNSGYAVIEFIPDKLVTGPCIVSTVTQVNINFGDGRLGFILPGTPDYSLYPGNYLLAVYQEYLDFNLVPVNVGPPQSLSYSQIDAKASNLNSVIYNEGTLALDTTNQAFYVRPRTVVLGICDPTSGYFQSMWDLMRVINPINNVINPSPTDCTVHSLPTMLTEHVDAKFADFNPINHDNAQYMFTGQASLVDGIIKFESALNLVQFDSSSESVKMTEVKTSDMAIKPEQVLIVQETNEGMLLKALSLGDTLPEASRIYVLGVYLNEFYSLSPFFRAKSELQISSANIKALRLGDMLFQWGCSLEGDVSFAESFTKNFTLQTKGSVLRKDLNGFSFTIIEKDKAQNWFAIGS